MTRYLNTKTQYGVETVDSLDRNEYKTAKEFKQAVAYLVNEYALCGMQVYVSQRCVK